MARAASGVATALLDLLETHAQVCDLWEAHHRKAANKKFASLDAEKEAHLAIQRDHLLPFMQVCSDKGFRYTDIMLMIPPAFKTTMADRRAILEDLECYAQEKYGA